MIYAVVGRIVVIGAIAVAAVYGTIGAYIFIRLFFFYCRCDFLNGIGDLIKMNTPWIIGLLAAIVFFAVFEALAFRHPDRFNTLSRAVFTIGQVWPLSIWLMGVFAGGLAVHFFWHWCPDVGAGLGLISGWAPAHD